ncbi:MAG: flagellar biosynthesis anti-sigma factor FlgM [Gammaproteobacteria bacterium]|jgi:negative regulator of flagellin synthesis FlgM|nr:flagellar biosynthesis anti-sigma factor FlgM [Gammaproteobacteria bacterium]
MVTEIKGTGPQNVSAVDSAVRKVGQTTPTAPAEAPKSSDVVTLTDLGARLTQLTESVAQVPEVDKARVAELKSAIESGSYRIDDKAIADKMTAFETQVGRGGSAS